MYKNLFIVVLSLLYIIIIAENETLRREKRAYFVFPMGGSFKIVLGVAVPYTVANNISQIKNYPPTISDLTQKRGLSRSDRPVAYLGLELLLQRYGLNGRSCLLRTICENAMNSLYHEGNGLYGHIIHIFLTPNCEDNDTDLDPTYCEAQKAGDYGVDCNSLYSDCLYGQNLLDMFSILDV